MSFFKRIPVSDMEHEFVEINASLNEIGLTVYTEEGESLRKIMAVEILSRKYPFIRNYQKDVFIKQAGKETKQIIKKSTKLIG